MTDGFEASVHSWDLSTGVDGPGTRFVLFLSGCPLRCLYCQNPDTWHMRDGHRRRLDAIMEDVELYRRFLQVARGGVTASGGEPLLQSEFVTEFFRAAQAWELSTALDTSGHLGIRADEELLSVTDLVLLDIKSYDPRTYRRLTGKEVAPTLAFAERLASVGQRMWIRFVLVPGVTDDAENVDGIARFAATLGPAVERVEILPFHRLGQHKYDALRMPFPLADTEPPDDALIKRVTAQFAAQWLPVMVA
ncbi:pyruvate formate lyase-activating protein [Nocardioides sp. GY 10113]|uniref:pyruvate formate-lyase-activating protein n=1 Tax=Nocardioides sp. GY 10113 TaxID=2569761 RepID=UPI0010A913BE|nr:pyruvate formate-lyase-activating protein [Nocardioides sp. GY 10113]TIC87603.1 pyruvate formate lyase-activating protein [Nocardioides sp. GY 10113]